MRPVSITHTGSGSGVTNSDPVRMNWRVKNTAFSLDTDGSTTAFTVQYTLTPPDGYASAAAWAAGATWFATTVSAATADAAGSLSHPVHGLRVQASASGTDTATVWITQADT